MRDRVPENMLGTYFSRRSSYTQSLNEVLAIGLALLLDFARSERPDYEINGFCGMFIAGGAIGILRSMHIIIGTGGTFYHGDENIFKLFARPLKDGNFQRVFFFAGQRKRYPGTDGHPDGRNFIAVKRRETKITGCFLLAGGRQP